MLRHHLFCWAGGIYTAYQPHGPCPPCRFWQRGLRSCKIVFRVIINMTYWVRWFAAVCCNWGVDLFVPPKQRMSDFLLLLQHRRSSGTFSFTLSCANRRCRLLEHVKNCSSVVCWVLFSFTGKINTYAKQLISPRTFHLALNSWEMFLPNVIGN